jgi:hypothetical protein
MSKRWHSLSVRSSVYLKFILIWLFFIGIVFFLIWNGLQIQAKSANKKGGWKKTFFSQPQWFSRTIVR